jgi:hypothetical protein
VLRAQPVTQPAPDPTQFGALANARGGIVDEFSNNPDLRRKLIASIDAEVGDQGDEAKQAYIESVMNRAVARKQSLDQTISTTSGYYPPETIAKLGISPSKALQDSLNPMIDRALRGSNVSGFATGNQSGKVTSDHAPITIPRKNPKSDDFIIENHDKDWAAGMSKQQADWRVHGQPVAPAVNVMGGYGEGEGSAAEPGDDSDSSGSSTQLGGHLGAVTPKAA